MSLTTEIIIRIVLVVSIIDTIEFYLISTHKRLITVPFAIGVIVITIIALVTNVLFCIYRSGIK